MKYKNVFAIVFMLNILCDVNIDVGGEKLDETVDYRCLMHNDNISIALRVAIRHWMERIKYR